jgi:hypothetical protein
MVMAGHAFRAHGRSLDADEQHAAHGGAAAVKGREILGDERDRCPPADPEPQGSNLEVVKVPENERADLVDALGRKDEVFPRLLDELRPAKDRIPAVQVDIGLQQIAIRRGTFRGIVPAEDRDRRDASLLSNGSSPRDGGG